MVTSRVASGNDRVRKLRLTFKSPGEVPVAGAQRAYGRRVTRGSLL
jgi:hypothetical protein